MVEQLAPVLAAEDARDFRPAVFRRRPGVPRFPRPPAGRHRRRPDRGSRRDAAAGDPPDRYRLHRPGGRGVRPRPDPRQRRRQAADGSHHRAAGARGRPPRRPSPRWPRSAGREVGAFFGGVLGGSIVPTTEIVVARWRTDRSRRLAPGARRAGVRPVALHGRHAGRGSLARDLYLGPDPGPRRGQPADRRDARPRDRRADDGGARAHQGLRRFRRARAPHRRRDPASAPPPTAIPRCA